MAATSTKQMSFHSSDDGSEPNTVPGLIAATQGILMPGAPLYLSEAGTWKATDTSDATGDAWHGFLVGLQDKSLTWPLTAQLSANDGIYVALIARKHKYVIYAESNGTDASPAQSNVGNDYGLVVSSTADEVGYTTVDFNSTTNVVVTVEDIMSNVEPSKYTTSDDPGACLVRVLTSSIEAQKG